MSTVPFAINDLNAGFAKIEGTVRLENGELHFEFYKSDDVLEAFKSSVKNSVLPLNRVSQLEIKKKLFGGAKLTITAKSESDFGDLEGTEFGVRKLTIKKKNRLQAEDLVTHSNIYISEQRIKDLDDDLA